MRGTFGLGAIFASLAVASPALAESQGALSIADPARFAAQLAEMGYDPEPFEGTETPTTVFHSGGSTYGIVLGGCTAGKACKYLVVFGSFTDIKNPPADWVARKNVDYDFIKVWVKDSGLLTYSTGMVVEGMSRATFRASIDMFVSSSDSLGREALVDGLTAEPAPPSK